MWVLPACHFPARIQAFQVFAAPFAGDLRLAYRASRRSSRDAPGQAQSPGAQKHLVKTVLSASPEFAVRRHYVFLLCSCQAFSQLGVSLRR